MWFKNYISPIPSMNSHQQVNENRRLRTPDTRFHCHHTIPNLPVLRFLSGFSTDRLAANKFVHPLTEQVRCAICSLSLLWIVSCTQQHNSNATPTPIYIYNYARYSNKYLFSGWKLLCTTRSNGLFRWTLQKASNNYTLSLLSSITGVSIRWREQKTPTLSTAKLYKNCDNGERRLQLKASRTWRLLQMK